MPQNSFLAVNIRVSLRQVWMCSLLVVAGSAAHAQSEVEPESPFSLSGFGTLGAVGQTGGNGWGFVRNKSQPGATSDLSATPDSRLGIQLNWNGGAQWEAGAQAVAQSVPSGTPAREAIQFAYVGYRPLPNTRIRVGRTSPDLFLFADSRNVGYALQWARPPVDFYGFAPLTSIDGIDLEQRWATDSANWRARFTAGSVKATVSGAGSAGLDFSGTNTMALGLSRENNGLLLKASYLRSRMKIDIAGVDQLRQGLGQLASLPVPGLAESVAGLNRNLWTGGQASYLALAAQYDTGPWTWIVEGSQLRVPNSPLSARRAYASVGYRKGDITYYGLASRVKSDQDAVRDPGLGNSLAPIVGPQAAAQADMLARYAVAAGDGYRFDQSTVGLGMRWDFASNAALKLQVDRFNIHRNGGAGWRGSDSRPGSGTLVSVLVDFVWGQ